MIVVFALKFPGKKPVATDILKKRMQRGVKYFDSGDYAMAKSEKKGGPAAAINRGKPIPLPLGVGKAIPTPENIPHRKTSVPSKLVEPHDQPQVGVTQ